MVRTYPEIVWAVVMKVNLKAIILIFTGPVFVPKFVALESNNLEDNIKMLQTAGVTFPAGISQLFNEH